MGSPNSKTELRVFPNIIVNTYSQINTVSSINCAEILKSFLEAYDADMQREDTKQKWVPTDRAESRLTTHLDMPTARALTRYIFGTKTSLKDAQIRDFAEAVDLARRPMELIYAEKPEDFVTMYGSGPKSCMSFDGDNENRWSLLRNNKWCPSSLYAFFPYTKGVYVMKNGKVAARTILFMNPNHDKNWKYIRIYSDNPEVTDHFVRSLAESGIHKADRCAIEPKFSFVVPGLKTDVGYVAPWPYLDSPLPRGENEWKVSFDNTTKEFTFYYKNSDQATLINRGNYIQSRDYMVLKCSTCDKTIQLTGRNGSMAILETEGDHIFCSDECAIEGGYVRIIDGTGRNMYKLPTNDMINVHGSSFIKCSTLKAAQDNGYFPVVEELGVFPEENDLVVSPSGYNFSDGSGNFYRYVGMDDIARVINERRYISKVPFKIANTAKVVEFNSEEYPLS
jgi:hypothetical protein